MMASHISEDDLTLYYYGEGRHRAAIERHLDTCAACAAVYREIAGTLAMIVAPEIPERGDQYGLEVWQRIRHRLPQEGFGGFGRFSWLWGFSGFERLAIGAAAAAVLVIGAFIAGRAWRTEPTPAVATAGNPPAATAAGTPATRNAAGQRILLTAVADHLDRSDRVL